MNLNKISETIEELSMQYVLSDANSIEDMEALLKSFNQIAKQAQEFSLNEIQTEAEKGLASITAFFQINSQSKDSDQVKVFESLDNTIKRLQVLCRNQQQLTNNSNNTTNDNHDKASAVTNTSSDTFFCDDAYTETTQNKIQKPENPKIKGGKNLIHPCELPEHLDYNLYGQFLSMQEEILGKMEALVLETEQSGNTNTLQELKRFFHTLKGEAGVLSLEDIGKVCHQTEDIIENTNFLSHVDIILASIDWIRDAFRYYSGLTISCVPVKPLLERIKKTKNLQNVSVVDKKTVSQVKVITEEKQPVFSDNTKQETRISSGQIKETINVDSERLDRVVDLIGELAIAETMVTEFKDVKQSKSSELQRNIGRLNKIIKELQITALSMRMLPVKSLFNKMGRVIRDLSKKSGKSIIFSMKGEDTELDKSIVDKLGDPLIHMTRNAVDHGIEKSFQERINTGKPKEGSIELRAFHKGGNIIIEIEDDGYGLDKEKILQKAIEKDIISKDASLDDNAILNLVFHAGFSTADKLTQISGRGVGMSVVKSSIESLHGHVTIESEKNKGTVFTIQLPLTLAVIDGMIVLSNKTRYIIPALSIVTSNRLDVNEITDIMEQGKMVKVQGDIVPLYDLDNLLHNNLSEHEVVIEPDSHKIYIVVESGGQKAALLVDELLGKQQIVIKSLGKIMKNIKGIAGGAILPDGIVGLIIDVEQLLTE